MNLIPIPRLEWSLAAESVPPTSEAESPEAVRCGWIHTAPERHVLDLFRRLDDSASRLPVPWWLRALARGELASRAEGFAFEDEVHALLTGREGWIFVPWSTAGEIGYWEYTPSDRPPMTVPTTVTLTDRHPGWLDILPAQVDNGNRVAVPEPGVEGLEAMLPRIESW
ncbi:hypothetical protein [Actinopolyspora mortivallis]|uniref:hypothetical protein n=1 Tax=Actinopolyspora mortivallis TaxID=33906 RepID=UPI0003622D91|nr:hypothetical protein [Actinopolyspora mortivallis]